MRNKGVSFHAVDAHCKGNNKVEKKQGREHVRRTLRVLLVLISSSVLLLAGCEDGASDSSPKTTPPKIVAPSAVSDLVATVNSLTSIRLTWTNPDPTADNLKEIRISWVTVATPDTEVGNHLVSTPTEGAAGSHIVIDLTANTAYRFSVVAVYNDGTTLSATPAEKTLSIDSDGDTLIDIGTLDMLSNIRNNLAGTFYSETAGASSGLQCGTNGATDCTGYELMRNLDFADGTSYASDSINNAWRPNAADDSSGAVVEPASGINRGWVPIGSGDSAQLTAIFEGNGYTIKNLYSHNVANTATGRTGLFGQIGASGVMRNLIIENGTVIGGTATDHIGIAVGLARGATITNTIVRGGSVNGGAGSFNTVGGLVGQNESTISASSSSATVNVASGDSNVVGGLVGTSSGTITASYAAGDVGGGIGNGDRVGGLVGQNTQTITASYATGNANAGVGNSESAGGLVGVNETAGTITASYATGNADGGEGTADRAGAIAGYNDSGTITASYGFGVSGGEVLADPSAAASPSNGTDRPSGVTRPNQLTAPGTTTPANTAAPAEWSQDTSNTLSAWDFGTAMQAPALKYADYDGATGTDYCASFSAKIPGTETNLSCNITLLPGQSALRTRSLSFDLIVPSITANSNFVVAGASFMLSATVRNTSSAMISDAAILTYYRSTDTVIDTSDTPISETDAIPTLNASATSMQDIMITAPATVGTYYYGACVSTAEGEANTSNNCSTAVQVTTTTSVDSDADTLIDISTLDMLNNIRHNLAGTFYAETAGASSGIQCGANGTTACIGYELMGNFDFADGASYASNSINNAWRPNAAADSSGAVVEPANGVNRGWEPIGSNDSAQFTAIFEGNGYTIKNLYSHNIANTPGGRTGLFGQIGALGMMRNLIIENGTVIGGTANDHIGIAVGLAKGGVTITNTIVRGGSANGGAGSFNTVGGLVGQNGSTISASSSSATVSVASGDSSVVGGLVGTSSGTIAASYAAGNVDGGIGNEDRVGGLVGQNTQTITASYATGDVNTGAGNNESAGGLVGVNESAGIIIASYATGNADGGEGTADQAGAIAGNNSGTITASYGFGNTDGELLANPSVTASPSNGTDRPSGVMLPSQLTAPGTTTPANTAAPAEWSQGARNTLSAWDFGTAMQTPALKYADYDGAGGTDYCSSFPAKIPSTETNLSCNTTLLPGQSALRSIALRPFNLTVPSITINPNPAVIGAIFILSATVENTGVVVVSPVSTLTYYSSTDATIDTSDTPLSETDAVSALSANATSDESIMVTAPATVGTYYYGACVITAESEANTTNNCSTAAQLTVILAPDLTIVDPQLSTPNLHPDATATFSAAVNSKAGSTDFTNLTLTYYRSTDNTIDISSDASIGTDLISALSTGQTSPREEIAITAPSSNGSYYYYACVSTVAGEANLSNNCSTTVQLTVSSAPDLVVVNPSFSPAIAVINATTTLSATVRNDGNANTTAASTLTYYRSTDNTIETSDTALTDTDTIPALNMSATSDQSVSVTAPATAGTYYYGACVSALTGEDATNNCSTAVRLTVVSMLDLTVVGAQLSTPNLIPSATATFSAMVRSMTDDTDFTTLTLTLTLTLTYYRSTDNTISISSDESIGTDSISALSTGQTSPREEIAITAPSSVGSYYYYACVSTVAGEVNLSNNCSTTVQLTVSSAPDLVVINPALSTATAITNATTTLSATVRNDGDANAAAASTLTYYSSTDATIDTSDTPLIDTDTMLPDTDTIPALDMGATSDQSVSVTAPAAPGTYYYGACVSALTGEDASNNCSTAVQLTVLASFSITAEAAAAVPTAVRIRWSAASAASAATLTVNPSPSGFIAPSASGSSFLLPVTAANSTLTVGTEYTFTVSATQLGETVTATATATASAELPIILWSEGAHKGNFQFARCNTELNKVVGAGAVPTALKAAGYTKGVFFGSTITYHFGDIDTDPGALGRTASLTDVDLGGRHLLVARVVDDTVTYTPVTNGGGQPTLTVSKALSLAGSTSAMNAWENAGTKEVLETLIGDGSAFWSMTHVNENLDPIAEYDSGASCTHATTNSGGTRGRTGDRTGVENGGPGCDESHRVLCLAR